MKKMITLLLFIAIMQQGFTQTQTFDIATYTPPKDWKKDLKEGVVIYSNTNKTTGSFCVLAIYASTPGTDDPQKDFKNKWNDQVVIPYKATANPKTQTQTSPEGWKAIAALATVKQEGVDAYVMLTVISGFGKVISVLANFNDPSYATKIDDVVGNMKLDKTTASIKETNQKNTSLQALGHMLFMPMKEWTMQRYTDAIIFKPVNLPANRYLETRIMESKPFSGSMQEAMETSWNDVLNKFQFVSPYNKPYYNIIKEKKSYKGWDYIQAEGTVKRIEDHSELAYEKYYINLFVIKLNDRIERIITVGLQNINGADYSPYNNSLYRNAIIELCLGLKFDDWKEQQVGALKGDALSGMYGGLKLGGGSLNASYALFFPNGQVFFGAKFPTEGFEGKNTWVYAELNTRNWGTYILQDGKGTINMGYGNMPLKVTGTNLVITTQNTDHTYEKFPSPDDAVLNGKYAFDGDWGGKPPSIIFSSDGKFIDDGALNILNHQTTDPDEFNITAKSGSGTYKIKNYTLVFTYTDGRKFQMVFTGNGFDRKNPSPASLTLSFNNDIVYKK
ncbi:MAG: hypothetical protein H0W12_12360 [Chitinophagaceae bacterium]|nr:hypothetical protein [Chitinophagaceae bacterium]